MRRVSSRNSTFNVAFSLSAILMAKTGRHFVLLFGAFKIVEEHYSVDQVMATRTVEVYPASGRTGYLSARIKLETVCERNHQNIDVIDVRPRYRSHVFYMDYEFKIQLYSVRLFGASTQPELRDIPN